MKAPTANLNLDPDPDLDLDAVRHALYTEYHVCI